MTELADLAVIVPTRSRPHAVEPLLRAFADTTRADTMVIFAVDGDPQADRYRAELARLVGVYPQVWHLVGPRRKMVGTLNYAVGQVIDTFAPDAVAYLGDDHRPESVGWDVEFLAALARLGTGLVYGDDGHQGQNLPTAVAMTADIPAALGYLAPPVLAHMYCDNFWKDLGEGAEAITYLPEVRIIHQHPAVHPAGAWDLSYRQSNAPDAYAVDYAAYQGYRDGRGLATDIATVRELRSSPAETS